MQEDFQDKAGNELFFALPANLLLSAEGNESNAYQPFMDPYHQCHSRHRQTQTPEIIRTRNSTCFESTVDAMRSRTPVMKNLFVLKDVSDIDRYSRFIFPASFVVFNIFYWVFYTMKANEMLLGVACLIAAVEFVGESKSVSEEEGTYISDEVRKDLKLAMKCSGSSKPVKKKDDTRGAGEEEDGMDQGIAELL
ncbi:unnamed protein product [Notodromas monacha]|uniref:Uncharacterized protein n=1 Tax=Notodromas monacha TaxID=399045 RepID=A0A7R9GEE1_9CRUS|nr:unnamed protein product [Notodromas monacha]CAG0919644.1 unnamed protein product [Notodromas monacha]